MISGVIIMDASLSVSTSLHGYTQNSLSFSSRKHDLRTPCGYRYCHLHSCLVFIPKKNKTGNCNFSMLSKSELMCTSMNDCDDDVHFAVASVEHESVREEEGLPNRDEKEAFSEYSFERKLVHQRVGVDQPSMVCKPIINGTKERLFYLEERNEEILSERLLNLSRRNKLKSALGLYRSMEYSGLQPNVHALNSLLSCLFRNGMPNDALTVFEFMKANDIITGHTYTIVLKAVADTSGCDAALRIFEDLDSSDNLKKHFDSIVYNTMISIFGKMNYWVQTEKIWRIMQKNCHIGTTVTYRLLICLFVRCGQNELALDVYHEMVQNGLEPSEDAMQAIIGACTKEGKSELALNVLDNMLNNGLEPNLVAFNSVISSLGKAGNVKDALKLSCRMKSLGHEPDSYTWNALLAGLYTANRHSDVLLLFKRIEKRKTSMLNIHIYNTALMSCKRLRMWDKALQLLWQMEASGFPISTASYNIVIGACEAARRPEVALEVYGHMIHQKHSPDTFTMLSLIRACIWGSRWDEVEEILNGFAPNGCLYNTAIQGLCLRGQTDLAKKLYRKMNENALQPDGKTRALMLQHLRRKSNYKR